MRTIVSSQVTNLVSDLCVRANFELPPDVLQALKRAYEVETSPRARWVLEKILRNAEIATQNHLPLCQDTGMVVCLVKLGTDVRVSGKLVDAINRGVRRAYTTEPLRHSVVADPLDRSSNTQDNTPAVIHVELIEGDSLQLQVMPKGGGSQNCSALWMLQPSAGEEGIVQCVVKHVRACGGRWCPPGVVGVGIGGTMEQAAILAKKAAVRPVGEPHPEPRWAALERRLLAEINATGIGPMGLGGNTTALDVHVEYYACHIASLPLAVELQCHVARRASGRL
jgi:fumarate hydratase subunit alpha